MGGRVGVRDTLTFSVLDDSGYAGLHYSDAGVRGAQVDSNNTKQDRQVSTLNGGRVRAATYVAKLLDELERMVRE
jgi:hypothetical protein